MTKTNVSPMDVAAVSRPSSDLTPKQAAIARYLDALDALVDDAFDHGTLEQLADVLAYNVARIAVSGGVQVTGDVLRRIGIHIDGLCEQRRAKQEAAQAQRVGAVQ